MLAQPTENQFTQYTIKDGLLEGSVEQIIQDKPGFLWLACGSGILRFDGFSFKKFIYDQDDSNSIREGVINHIFIDGKSRLWAIGANFIYLYHPDSQYFEHFCIGNINNDRFTKICAEENEDLIIAGNKSLYRFNTVQKRLSLFEHNGLPKMICYDYVKDNDNIEWIATENGLIKYDRTKKQIKYLDSALYTKNKVLAPSSILLLGNGQLATRYLSKLLLVDRENDKVTQFDLSKNQNSHISALKNQSFNYNNIQCVYKLNDSVIVSSINGGLSFFNYRNNTFSYWEPEEGYNRSLRERDNEIYSVLKDREGIFWIGGADLKKLDYRQYQVKKIILDSADSKQGHFNSLFDLYHYTDGNFLLGGVFALGYFDLATGKLEKKLNDKKTNDYIHESKKWGFDEDETGRIWCHSDHSLYTFDVNNHKMGVLKKIEVPESANTGFIICEIKSDHKGHLLLATTEGLIIKDTSGKTIKTFYPDSKPPSQISNKIATTVFIDHNGCIWVGTLRGLNKIEKDRITVKQYKQDKNNSYLPDWKINGIVEDKKGIIWFATSHFGIGRLDPISDSVKFFGIKEGLPTTWFQTLRIDDDDNLWAKSTLGILKLNTQTLQSELYTEEEGFPFPQDIFNIFYSKINNKLYLLTRYALFEVNAHKSNDANANPDPVAYITGLTVFDKEIQIPLNEELKLNYKNNFINIQFTCLQFHNNNQIRYAYKMEGVDNNWVYPNFKRSAYYTDLSPGHYCFLVKAQTPEGHWSNTVTKLYITILPPFWEKWWFYVLEALVVSVIVVWVTKLYASKKLTKQKIQFEKQRAVADERGRIASDMHDELGSGLTSIRLLSEVASLKATDNNPVKPEIKKILKSAVLLSENLREVIWTMNNKFDKLEDFIIFIRAYSVEYFDNTDIRFEFNRPAVVPELIIHGQFRRNIFLCVKEACHNILKHSGATYASITIDIGNQILTIIIKDNGVGLNSEKQNQFGNGLNIMRGRLEKLGSDLDISTDDGTSLTFKIDLQNGF